MPLAPTGPFSGLLGVTSFGGFGRWATNPGETIHPVLPPWPPFNQVLVVPELKATTNPQLLSEAVRPRRTPLCST